MRSLTFIFALLYISCSHIYSQKQSVYLDSLKNSLADSPPKNQAGTIFLLSEKYMRLSLDSAVKFAESGLVLAKELKDNRLIGKAYDLLGGAHYMKRQYLLATRYFEAGMHFAVEANDQDLITHLKNSMGISHAVSGNYKDALIYFKEAYERFEGMGKDKQATGGMINIGKIYDKLGETDKAIHTLEIALVKADSLGTYSMKFQALNLLGKIYEKLNIYDKALEYQNQALHVSLEKAYTRHIISSYESIGRLYVKQKRYQRAIEQYDLAMEIIGGNGNNSSRQKLWMAYGKLEESRNNFTKAREFYQQSLELAQRMKNLKASRDLRFRMAQLYDKMGDHTRAYDQYVMYTQLKDSINVEQSRKEIAEIGAKYRLDEKEAENERLKQEQQIQQLQNYMLLTVAVIIFTLLIALYNRFRIKQKSNIALEKRNTELAEKTRHIHIQNQLLETQSEAIQDQNNRLKQANADLEQFAYAASHDLREPLRTISSYINLLKRRYEGDLDETAHEFMDFATDGAMRMDDLLKDLLTYSRVGRMAAHSLSVNLNTVVESVMNDLASQIHEHKARISVQKLPSVPGFKSELHLLFQNLISNAIKFRNEFDEPEISIEVSMRKNVYLISVSDNGIGMNTAYHDKVFTIFQRLHTRDKYEGTGIGLAICKKIVENHKGAIWFESEQGKGTTFFIELPQK